jgi:hypothetical protein
MNLRREKIFSALLFGLGGGWLAAGYLRLIHWTCRIELDPDFFTLPFWRKSVGVSFLYLFGACFLLAFAFMFLSRRVRRGASAGLVLTLAALVATTLWARPYRPGCEEVRERMKESGTARDASEGWFGRIKIDEPPLENFATRNEKVTWWGKFNKPFEYWGEPAMEASWYDPEGREVARVEVDAQKCKLAKATIRREYFQPGLWRVDISCKDGARLDSQTFQVGSPENRRSEVLLIQ